MTEINRTSEIYCPKCGEPCHASAVGISQVSDDAVVHEMDGRNYIHHRCQLDDDSEPETSELKTKKIDVDSEEQAEELAEVFENALEKFEEHDEKMDEKIEEKSKKENEVNPDDEIDIEKSPIENIRDSGFKVPDRPSYVEDRKDGSRYTLDKDISDLSPDELEWEVINYLEVMNEPSNTILGIADSLLGQKITSTESDYVKIRRVMSDSEVLKRDKSQRPHRWFLNPRFKPEEML